MTRVSLIIGPRLGLESVEGPELHRQEMIAEARRRQKNLPLSLSLFLL